MLTLLLLAQLTQPLDLVKATTLRPGEIVRVYRRGGRTRLGLYQTLIVATKTRVFVKTLETSATYQLDRDQQLKLADAARASLPKLLLEKPRANPMFPSAYDGVDVFLAYNRSGKVVTWTNERFELPEKPFPLLSFLEDIRHGGID